jgi:hypothetical protein
MTRPTDNYAVAARRQTKVHKALDDYPTPPWSTRAMIKTLRQYCWVPSLDGSGSCWEPASNRGFMVRPLREFFKTVWHSDVHDYGAGAFVDDFLLPSVKDGIALVPDWIITNPPFVMGTEFIQCALDRAQIGVAMLVRSSFLEGKKRYERIFRDLPPQFVMVYVERVPMVSGRCAQDATTATAYSWLVWVRESPVTPWQIRDGQPRVIWIPPMRAECELNSDYRHPGGAHSWRELEARTNVELLIVDDPEGNGAQQWVPGIFSPMRPGKPAQFEIDGALPLTEAKEMDKIAWRYPT